MLCTDFTGVHPRNNSAHGTEHFQGQSESEGERRKEGRMILHITAERSFKISSKRVKAVFWSRNRKFS